MHIYITLLNYIWSEKLHLGEKRFRNTFLNLMFCAYSAVISYHSCQKRVIKMREKKISIISSCNNKSAESSLHRIIAWIGDSTRDKQLRVSLVLTYRRCVADDRDDVTDATNLP